MFVFENSISKDLHFEIRTGGIRRPCEIYQLFYKRIVPHQKVSDTQIIILHDFSLHHAYYEAFAKEASRRKGMVVTLLDYKGHGLSGGERNRIDSYDSMVLDLKDFWFTLVRENQPVIVIGVGLGAMLFMEFHSQFKTEITKDLTCFFISPLIVIQMGFISNFKTVSRSLEFFLDKIKISDHLKSMVFSFDPEFIKIHSSDSLISQKASLHTWLEIKKLSDKVRSRGLFGPKSYYLLAENDALVDIPKSKVALKKVMSDNSLIKEYPQMVHDLINDLHKEQVIDDIFHWIEGD